MIGTILIAVIGYGLALHYAFMTFACVYIEHTDDAAKTLYAAIVRYGLLGFGFAASTRWLVGGAV